jgi:hypothetical protein
VARIEFVGSHKVVEEANVESSRGGVTQQRQGPLTDRIRMKDERLQPHPVLCLSGCVGGDGSVYVCIYIYYYVVCVCSVCM